MLKLLRYTLAAIFLAASVGCLGLWWRSLSKWEIHNLRSPISPSRVVSINTYYGAVSFVVLAEDRSHVVSFQMGENWAYHDLGKRELHDGLRVIRQCHGVFGPASEVGVYLPLLYPALTLALAAVGVLRLGKPFTIRSALIATTVIAVLLGMVVAL